eukprot:TRINITY_DN3749_c0_g1_i1.p2 TRINITY_DN3749_c0_g1~~TRINITY_DN3749_c0_g1_i1.p2  ORF type:complete len:467 (-),score=175.47 TRINITY_DN3749_c0_g1_i1:150-1406(-)
MAEERFQRFFAVAVEPKKLYTQIPQFNLHITQVVLDTEASSKDRTVLIAQVDGQNVPIASLRLGTTEQVQLDVLFDEGVELSFSVHGSNTVHVIGYFVNDMEEPEEDSESESDLDEEDFQDAVLSKKARLDLEAADAEAAAEGADDEDDDEDYGSADEDDEDDDEEEDDEDADESDDAKDESSKKRVRLPEEADKATAKATPAKKAKPDTPAAAANGKPTAAKPTTGAAPAAGAAKPSTPAAKAATSPAATPVGAATTPGGAEETKSQKKKRKQLEKAAAKEAATASQSPAKPAATGAQQTPKKADGPAKRTLPSGLQIEELQLGHGKVVEPGKMVGVKYIGRLMNGRKFDESRNKPFSFRLGTGQVIKGWDDGLKGMRVGGKRRLVIPPALAYGKRGAGSDIPPNATLNFEVEVVSA